MRFKPPEAFEQKATTHGSNTQMMAKIPTFPITKNNKNLFFTRAEYFEARDAQARERKAVAKFFS